MIGVYRSIGYHCYQTLDGAFTARGVSLGSWIDGLYGMDCLECSLHLEEFDGYNVFQERRDLRHRYVARAYNDNGRRSLRPTLIATMPLFMAVKITLLAANGALST